MANICPFWSLSVVSHGMFCYIPRPFFALGLRPNSQGIVVMSKFVVCALYKFVSLENFEDLRQPLQQFMEDRNIKGTLLLASEGINGTVSGTRETINELLAYLNLDPRINPITHKESLDETQPFHRIKVKLKKRHKWSLKYKKSINCRRPRGFSQRQYGG